MDSKAIERFWSKVKTSTTHFWNGTPCQEWIGKAKSWNGYGLFKVDGIMFRAHRLAWGLSNGKEIPEGLCVCHHCDNRLCCEPSHLFLGTRKDNHADSVEKGRASYPTARSRQPRPYQPSPSQQGSLHWRSKITEREVIEIRRLVSSGERTQTEVAREMGLSCSQISRIVHRKYWKHI
jgi:hypothetical protein